MFEVERIEKERTRNKKRQYYVKWKGYPASENSWEPEKSILDPQLIASFKHRTGKVSGNQLASSSRKKARAEGEGSAGAGSTAAATKPAAPKPAAPKPAPPPTAANQRPRRAIAGEVAAAAKRMQDEMDVSDSYESGSSSEGEQHPPAKRKARMPAAKKHK